MRRGPPPCAAVLLAFAFAFACSKGPDAPGPPAPAPPPSAAPAASPLPDPLPEVVARVNGTAIPLRHARIIVEQTFKGQTPTPAQEAAEYRRAVDQLVVREMLRQEARARKIEADEAAVSRLHQQLRSEYPDAAAFQAFLATQGLDEKTVREELRTRAVVERLIQQETLKVPATVPEPEARAYYAANQSLFESAGRPLPFEEVRERITQQIVTFKRQEALNDLLVRLGSQGRVEKFI